MGSSLTDHLPEENGTAFYRHLSRKWQELLRQSRSALSPATWGYYVREQMTSRSFVESKGTQKRIFISELAVLLSQWLFGFICSRFKGLYSELELRVSMLSVSPTQNLSMGFMHEVSKPQERPEERVREHHGCHEGVCQQIISLSPCSHHLSAASVLWLIIFIFFWWLHVEQ